MLSDAKSRNTVPTPNNVKFIENETIRLEWKVRFVFNMKYSSFHFLRERGYMIAYTVRPYRGGGGIGRGQW